VVREWSTSSPLLQFDSIYILITLSRTTNINDRQKLRKISFSGRAYAAVFRLSSVTLCIVAKRCVLQQKLHDSL